MLMESEPGTRHATVELCKFKVKIEFFSKYDGKLQKGIKWVMRSFSVSMGLLWLSWKQGIWIL